MDLMQIATDAAKAGNAGEPTKANSSIDCVSGGFLAISLLIALAAAVWIGAKIPSYLVDSWGVWFLSSALLLLAGLCLFAGSFALATRMHESRRVVATHVTILAGVVVSLPVILAPTVVGLHHALIAAESKSQAAHPSVAARPSRAATAAHTPTDAANTNAAASKPASSPKPATPQTLRARAQAGDARAQTELAMQLFHSLPRDGSLNSEKEKAIATEARSWLEKAVA